MYIYRNISPKIIFQFSWKRLLFFIVYGSTAVYAYHHFQHEGIQFSIPYLPLSTLGIAVAFEIRGFQKVLIYRHLAYINALRLQLRMPTSFSLTSTKRGRKMRFYKGVPGGEDWMSDVAPFLSCTDEISVIKDKVNTATQIIRNQGDTLNEIFLVWLPLLKKWVITIFGLQYRFL